MNAEKKIIDDFFLKIDFRVITIEELLHQWDEFKKSKSIIDKPLEYEIISWSNCGNIYRSNKILMDGSVIHSVRRLSDGVVFAVGQETNKGKIVKFLVIDWLKEIYIECNGSPWPLDAVQPVSKALFICTNGFEVFDNTYYFRIDDNFNVRTELAFENIVPPTALATFRSEEAANEFVRLNKPTYSLKEISDLFIKLNVIPEHAEKIIDGLDKLKS